ncbi:MAG: hypothetical protein CM15mP103_09760 [Gammaproteobacteria bacterium]|nr:MAG: hypothetical protein CM15mP103_09760 [Gammaproteobacteria bacterium]
MNFHLAERDATLLNERPPQLGRRSRGTWAATSVGDWADHGGRTPANPPRHSAARLPLPEGNIQR